MIYSMTGFGRSEFQNENIKISSEIKSVNHKYLDVSVKLPRKLNLFEIKIRNLLKEYAVRGKVDIFISYENLADCGESLRFNESLAREYFEYYKKIKDMLNLTDDIRTSSIARCQDVLVLEESSLDEDLLWPYVSECLTSSLKMFCESRLKEGEALKDNILDKLDKMEQCVSYIEERLPDIINEYRQKLTDKVSEFLENSQMDEGRIAAEVTLFADKIAVDEELVRLKTHISNMRDILNKGGEAGRNLDFIAQEMNRESNTILSKSSDIEVTNCGIELKTLIEKIREQVQNIE